MRKNELIHLHALLRTVADRLLDSDFADEEALAAYRSLGVTPMSLQASRDDHEAAVSCLAAAVATAVTRRDVADDDVVDDDTAAASDSGAVDGRSASARPTDGGERPAR